MGHKGTTRHIFPFMYQCNTITQIRRLKFFLTDNEDSNLNIRSDVLEQNGSNKLLSLFVQPNEYQPLTELTSPDIRDTGSGAFLSVSKVRKGFNATFMYEETNIRICLQLLAKNCFTQKKYIKVLDYISPEPEDYFTGFTLRTGIIRLPISHLGSVGQTAIAEKTPDGFSLSFVETHLRYV